MIANETMTQKLTTIGHRIAKIVFGFSTYDQI